MTPFDRARTLEAEAIARLTQSELLAIDAIICRTPGKPSTGAWKDALRRVATGPTAALLAEADQHYWAFVAGHSAWIRRRAQYHCARLRHDFGDMLQAARLGAFRAALRFDPGNGAKFTTFADDWVRVTCDRTRQRDRQRRALSLDVPIGDSDILWGDQLEAPTEELPDHLATPRLRAALDALTPVERASLSNLMDEDLTLAVVGSHWGISRERVRQIQVRAVKKLRETLENPLAY